MLIGAKGTIVIQDSFVIGLANNYLTDARRVGRRRSRS